jgi:simple sugar transport system permease protein
VTAAVVSPETRLRRQLGRTEISGIIVAVVGVLVTVLLAPGLDGKTKAFAFEPPPDPAQVKFDPPTLVAAIGILFVVVGLLSVFGQAWPRALRLLRILAGICTIPLVLAAALAVSNASNTNVTNLMVESMVLATPIALGSMTGLWCERSGIVNIGIEGQMLSGAGVGFMLYAVLGDAHSRGWLWFSVVMAMATGSLLGLLLAWLSITLQINQIVAGVVINLFALGITGFLRSEVIVRQGISTGEALPRFGLPLLDRIPIIGDQVFRGQPIFFLTVPVVLGTWFLMYKTPWGLRVRSCGENPQAAESLGIDVIKLRYQAVVLGGAIAGLAGAWFSMEAQSRFEDNMTNFTGFIALAALIFGKWNPWGALGGAALFGFARALGSRMQILGVEVRGFEIPSNFWQMTPFVVTIIVVAGAVGRAVPPAAEGIPYRRSR